MPGSRMADAASKLARKLSLTDTVEVPEGAIFYRYLDRATQKYKVFKASSHARIEEKDYSASSKLNVKFKPESGAFAAIYRSRDMECVAIAHIPASLAALDTRSYLAGGRPEVGQLKEMKEVFAAIHRTRQTANGPGPREAAINFVQGKQSKNHNVHINDVFHLIFPPPLASSPRGAEIVCKKSPGAVRLVLDGTKQRSPVEVEE